MKNRINKIIPLLLIVIIVKSTAWANAGTALMLGTFMHLVIGNLLIGIVEGLIIGFFFRQFKWRSMGLMILANYFSAWTTLILINLFKPIIEQITIYQLHPFMTAAILVAFVYTIFAEWFFVHYSFQKAKRKLYLTFLASLAVQSISYTGLIYYYVGISGTGIFRNAEIVSTSEVNENINADIYYIKKGTGDIYKLSLPENSEEPFYTCTNNESTHALSLRGAGDAGCYDLYAEIENTSTLETEDRLMLEEAVHGHQIDWLSSGRNHEYSVFGYEPADYRHETDKQWLLYVGVWADAGLIFYNSDTKEEFYVSLETPFMSWYVYNPTILEGDNVIYEWGNQICLYSRPSQKLAMLTRGSYPIVVNKTKEEQHVR